MTPPLPVVKAHGSILIDENGSEYIDAISSWWVNIHGHSHPYIAGKLYQQALQLEHVIFSGFTHEPAVRLAERLLKILPGNFSRIFFSDDGSTATEVAVKMAIQFWSNTEPNARPKKQGSRNKILALKNGYHGDTFGAMSVSDRSIFTLAFQDLLFDVIFIDTPSEESLPGMKKLIDLHASGIAAFIYEPLVQGAGGMKMYNAALLDELLLFIREKNIVCIADEVMTGFGRTGKMFAGEYMQTKADIICLSKGLTGGTLPLGVTACSQEVYDAFVSDDVSKTFFHGHSFTANPLACAAALASLDLFGHEQSMKKVDWITQRNIMFAQQLKQLKGIKNVRTLGTILAFEVMRGEDEYINTISHLIMRNGLARGVYLRPLGNTVYIMPPYCITASELEKIYSVILEVI